MTPYYRVIRLLRTPSSEIYLIWDGDRRVGQADIHYVQSTIHATVILETDVALTDEELIMTQLDDEVASSYMPRFEREDFVAHVFRGNEVNRYTDCTAAGDPDDDDDVSDE